MRREAVQIREPLKTDDVGDPIEGDESVPWTVNGCKVWPRRSSEREDRGSIILSGWNVWVPRPQRPIHSDDEVNVRGQWYEIEGKPGVYEKGTMLVLMEVGT